MEHQKIQDDANTYNDKRWNREHGKIRYFGSLLRANTPIMLASSDDYGGKNYGGDHNDSHN
jgi:hypothetical protein